MLLEKDQLKVLDRHVMQLHKAVGNNQHTLEKTARIDRL